MAPGASNRPTLRDERRLWRAGHRWVAGMDEVGRGAWAGPVSVGVAVIVPSVRSSTMPRWLRDSKLLDESRRETVFDDVARWCADGAVGHATAAECDRWGMTAALRVAAYRALGALELAPEALVIDGPMDLLAERPLRPPDPVGDGAGEERGRTALPLPEVALPPTVLTRVDADMTCAAVAAASILAKVVRDRIMRGEAEHFPPYEFERNKGYPSPTHQWALRGYGPSAIHRRSWAFIDHLPFGPTVSPRGGHPAGLPGAGGPTRHPAGLPGAGGPTRHPAGSSAGASGPAGPVTRAGTACPAYTG